MEFIICETIESARQFIGGTSPLHFADRSLRKLKEEAISDKQAYTAAAHAAGLLNEPARRMQFNGAIAAKNSIINKIDSLLKTKGL